VPHTCLGGRCPHDAIVVEIADLLRHQPSGSELPKRRAGGGLLIHPDLFAQTDFRLFCLRYDLPSCTRSPHLQSIVQQVFSNNFCLYPSVNWHMCFFTIVGTTYH
jgi:hypothetical protein